MAADFAGVADVDWSWRRLHFDVGCWSDKWAAGRGAGGGCVAGLEFPWLQVDDGGYSQS